MMMMIKAAKLTKTKAKCGVATAKNKQSEHLLGLHLQYSTVQPAHRFHSRSPASKPRAPFFRLKSVRLNRAFRVNILGRDAAMRYDLGGGP